MHHAAPDTSSLWFILPLLLATAGLAFNTAAQSPEVWADDFSAYAEGADGSAHWQVQSGTWRVQQGAYVGQDCGSTGIEARGVFRGDGTWRDYVLSVRFKIDGRGSDWRDGPWFGIRCDKDGDGYYLLFTDRDCQFHKVVYGVGNGGQSPLAQTPWQPDDQWHSLRIEARENRFKIELDGSVLLELKDDAHLGVPSLRRGGIILSARRLGLAGGKTTVQFDDVKVEFLKKH